MLLFVALVFLVSIFGSALCSLEDASFLVEDVFKPEKCDVLAKDGDHVLLEYEVIFANGTAGASLKAPSQLYHVSLNNSNDLPVMNVLSGMCKNSTRRLTWDTPTRVNLSPIFLKTDGGMNTLDQGVSVLITVVHVTEAEDYKIFDYLRYKNITAALDMIEEHRGVNAVDEYGQSTLMMSVQMENLAMVSALLNTRMPKVDVNLPKSSGYTATFYALEKSSPSILQALLRRGADPNVALKQDGAKGNTPLHFTCLLEKSQHAEMLFEYGADPDAVNQHGQTPLQMLPNDAVRSTKMYFKKMFEDAYAKKQASASGATTSATITASAPDL